MRSLTRLFLFATVASLVGLSTVHVAPAAAVPTWAPAATAPIHPGVQTFTSGAQCTANFVFYSDATVYIGQAAHCASTEANTSTNGCTTNSLPLGTPVQVTGASQPGTLVYSSWITMQALGESDPNICAFNDFALVRLNGSDGTRVNPSVPYWGGPTGVNSSGAALLSRVYSYGNSALRLGLTPLAPKTGVSLGDIGNGWEHEVLTVTPGIPGDSGSAFLDAGGAALGVLSTFAVAPIPLSNGVGDIARELNYMNSHTTLAASLALGTEPFRPDRLLLL